MTAEVVIDGKRYIPVDDFGDIRIVVLERGFVYVGHLGQEGADVNAEEITISCARCIIKWGTTEHLGQLVNGPLVGTKLGASCTVHARISKVIHTIEVSQDEWSKHVG